MFRVKKPFVVPPKKEGKFVNKAQETRHSFLIPTVTMLIKSWFAQKQKKIEVTQFSVPPAVRSQALIFTWIGHSTFLIQVAGLNILTDPIFGNASPFFRRNAPPGIALEQLPPIDLILISHNHWDHMHGPTLKKLKSTHLPTMLVPEGDKAWFDARGFDSVNQMSWGQTHGVKNAEVKVTFLPAHHWSRRGLFDRNKSLWGSWMIETGTHTIYFAGDTAYAPHFGEIAQEFKHIDYALLPIGPCEPRHAMKHTHLDAREAGQAFLDLNAKVFIPMHWGTFNFGTDSYHAPMQLLNAWWKENELQLIDKQLQVLSVGSPLVEPVYGSGVKTFGQISAP
jgi:L-ascorbate metabolism protein UlaG (beta-lactamase superfamily)